MKPEEIYGDEREWTIEGFMADLDAVCANPMPAPPGLELVECDAEPRHWPTYVAHVDGMYPTYCHQCAYQVGLPRQNELVHKAEHRRWHRWRVTARFARHAYAWGLIAASATHYNGCKDCPKRTTIRWRGKRSYILGARRETWGCLLKRHHIRTPLVTCRGLCSKCCPCPDCGSTDPTHYDCGGAA